MNTRKVFISLFIFIFIFSNAAVFAQMPVVAPGVGPSLEGLPKIGVVAAIQGKVEVMTPGAAGRVVQSGEEIFIGDEVKTDALGHLQILLLDETVFTIGPNSAIIIDKFIYDPGTHVGKMEASITKGVFRYVSGKIAANKPENVTIKLPTATIGVRGTIIAGEASATGSMAMLMGPGSKNETGATIGSFVMSGTGENSGQQEHVNRTGFGVSVDQAGGLSGVFMVPDIQVQHLGEALLPAPRQDLMPVGGENDQGPSGARPPVGKTEGQGPSGAQPPAGRTEGQGPSGARSPNAPAPGMMFGTYTSGSATGGTTAGGMPAAGPVSTMGGATADGMKAPGTVAAPMMTTGIFGAGFNAGQASGAQTYSGFQTTSQFNMMGMLQTNLNQDTTVASQDAAHNTAMQSTQTQTVRDTLNRDMIARVAPIVTYEHYGGVFTFKGLQGTLDAVVRVDFAGDKVMGGAGSFIKITVPDGISSGTALVDGCELSNKLFNSSNPSLPATFQWAAGTLTQLGAPNFDTTGFFNQVTIQFQDVVKQSTDTTVPSTVDIAAQMKVNVNYSRSGDSGTGEVIAPQV